MNYYNDNDAYCCRWLRNLMTVGLIPQGIVDDRDIREVEPDVNRFAQCHFFAGIGGWSYALELAEWPADRPVWTASCPCQPVSCAGKRKGHADERHLWPELYRLVRQCRPDTIFGEQVASNDGLEWLDGISLDLEEIGYAVGTADLPAACVGAPHIRQRLWWVAHAEHTESGLRVAGQQGQAAEQRRDRFAINGPTGGLADSIKPGLEGRQEQPARQECQALERSGGTGGLGDTTLSTRTRQSIQSKHVLGPATFWDDYELIPCRDGKQRRIEPGTFPLAHGVPARVGKLRAYGNAIVPQVAAKFVKIFMDEQK